MSGPEADPTLHETPLSGVHRALGARLIEFGGWLMPVQYRGILSEHRAVRERAGLFDLSHMGELNVDGEGAGDALAAALVSDPRRLDVGRAQYSMLCQADGGIVDDLIVYRTGASQYLVVANAANAGVVSDLLAERVASFRAIVDDRSQATGLCAIQGPLSAEILSSVTDVDLAGLHYYGIRDGSVAGIPALVARTGYTGEDGFEIFVEWDRTAALWAALQDAGLAAGLEPCGLGARDTLRLEAGMPLYGNELDRSTNPYEAGLRRVVRLDKPGAFVGRDALTRLAEEPVARRLVGLEITGRGIARRGHEVFRGERRTGAVTSGTLSPTLGRAIAMAYVAPDDGEPGTILSVAIRDQLVDAVVTALPFYRRPR